MGRMMPQAMLQVDQVEHGRDLEVREWPPGLKAALLGPKGVRALADGRRTSLILEVGWPEWTQRLERHLKPGFRFIVQGRHRSLKVETLVRIVRVCRHRHLAAVPACSSGHDPAALRPDEPQWLPILETALTRGGNLTLDDAERARREGAGWLVVDVAALGYRESREARADRDHRNLVELVIAESEARFLAQRKAAGLLGSPELLSEEERAHRIRSSAYTKRLGEVLEAGGDPALITMDELDLEAAAARLEEREQDRLTEH
jgi:hypothetical protein